MQEDMQINSDSEARPREAVAFFERTRYPGIDLIQNKIYGYTCYSHTTEIHLVV